MLNTPTRLFFLYHKGKLIASKLGFVAGQKANLLDNKTSILKCSGYHCFLHLRQTEANLLLLEEAGEKKITPLFLASQILVLIATGLKLLFSTVRRYHFHREALQNKQKNPHPLFQGVKLCYNNNHQEMVRLLSAAYLRHRKATSQGLTQVFTCSCPL